MLITIITLDSAVIMIELFPLELKHDLASTIKLFMAKLGHGLSLCDQLILDLFRNFAFDSVQLIKFFNPIKVSKMIEHDTVG